MKHKLEMTNNNWRDLPPTEKQLEYISNIEEFGVQTPKFTGTTRGEASDYIDKYKDMLELGQMSSWQLNYM